MRLDPSARPAMLINDVDPPRCCSVIWVAETKTGRKHSRLNQKAAIYLSCEDNIAASNCLFNSRFPPPDLLSRASSASSAATRLLRHDRPRHLPCETIESPPKFELLKLAHLWPQELSPSVCRVQCLFYARPASSIVALAPAVNAPGRPTRQLRPIR